MMGGVLLTGGLVLYTRGSRVVPAAELALLSGIEVVLAPDLGLRFSLTRRPTGTRSSGALFILGAAIWNGVSRGRADRSAPGAGGADRG